MFTAPGFARNAGSCLPVVAARMSPVTVSVCGGARRLVIDTRS